MFSWLYELAQLSVCKKRENILHVFGFLRFLETFAIRAKWLPRWVLSTAGILIVCPQTS